MEAVCYGKQWDVALAHDNEGNVIGALPYLYGSKMGLRYVIQPQLTQYNGPWYKSDDTEMRHRADNQFRAHFNHLRLKLFQQNYAPGLSDMEGWKEYNISPRVTYRLEDIADPQQVFNDFDKSRRQRQIRRAERVLKADDGITPEEFARFHTEYWRSRGQKDLLSEDFMVRIINTALGRRQGILLGVRDGEGTLQGARFVAFDDNCGYALLSALHPLHPNGTSALLFWLILQQLSGKCHSFDFEGSMIEAVEHNNRQFGGLPVPYMTITKKSKLISLIELCRK